MLYIANEILNIFGLEQAAVLAVATVAAGLVWATLHPRLRMPLLALLAACIPCLAGVYLAIVCRNTSIATIELLQHTEALSTPQAAFMLDGTRRAVVRIVATGVACSIVLLLWRRSLSRRITAANP